MSAEVSTDNLVRVEHESAQSSDNILPDTEKSKGLPSVNTKGALIPRPSTRTHSLLQPRKSSNVNQNGSFVKKATSTMQLSRNDGTLRRSSSSQNLSAPVERSQSCRQSKQTAAASAMAYNAELLASFEKEKKSLESRISELTQITERRKTEIERYKIEVRNLKMLIPEDDLKTELLRLRHENKDLRDGKTDANDCSVHSSSLVCSQCISKLPEHTASSNLPHAAMITSSASQQDLLTPDHPSTIDTSLWDRQSTRSAKSDTTSEMSLDYLHHRIMLMEETNYSTTEELEATIQELQDLQRTVDELTGENETLASKNSRLLEALCEQTIKLENCRTQIEHLKALLLNDHDFNPNRSEHERQLVELLKGAQEEREELMLQQTELANTVSSLEIDNRELQQLAECLRERCASLEARAQAGERDKRAVEQQLSETRELLSSEQIECKRYQNLLDSEHSKLVELEQYRKAGNGAEVERLLHTALDEKAAAENRITELEQKLAISQKDLARQQEQYAQLQKDMRQSEETHRSEVTECSTRADNLQAANIHLQEQAAELRALVASLQHECSQSIGEKQSLGGTIGKLQHDLQTSRKRIQELECELDEAAERHERDRAEWQQFQTDLQMAVVIANDISADVQGNYQKLKDESATLEESFWKLQDRLKATENELELLRATAASTHPPPAANGLQKVTGSAATANKAGKTITTSSPSAALQQQRRRTMLVDTMGRDLTQALQMQKSRASFSFGSTTSIGAGAQQSLSVKSLIRGIEEQVKANTSSLSASSNSSCRSSSDNLNQLAAEVARAEQRARAAMTYRNSPPSSKTTTSDSRLSLPLTMPLQPAATEATSSTCADGNAIDLTLRSGCSTAANSVGIKSALKRNSATVGSASTTLLTAATNSAAALVAPSTNGASLPLMSGATRGASPAPSTTVGAAGFRSMMPSNATDSAKVAAAAAASAISASPAKAGASTNASAAELSGVNVAPSAAKKDPLAALVKQTGGSKRNALLKWCQTKTQLYKGVDITNFSSSWNDGLAFCALLHSYLPQLIPYKELNDQDKRRNFELAFKAAETVGIASQLDINEMASIERPDWQAIMQYVTSIYKHFEIDS